MTHPSRHLLTIVLTLLTLTATANEPAVQAFDNNNLKLAKSLFSEDLNHNPKNSEALVYLSHIALLEEDSDLAEQHIEQALAAEPNNANSHFEAGQIYGQIAGNASIFSAPGYAKKSLHSFKKAVELAPENLDYRKGLMGFYLAAPSIVGGDLELASEQADQIAKIDPEDGFIARLGVLMAEENDPALQAQLGKIEREYEQSAQAYFFRGMYRQSKEQFDLALEDFSRAKSLTPKNDQDTSPVQSLYQIGRTSVLSGQNLDTGILALSQYIELSPKQRSLPSLAWAKFRLGLLQLKKGSKGLAAGLFEEAKSSTQDKTLLKELKKALKQLKK